MASEVTAVLSYDHKEKLALEVETWMKSQVSKYGLGKIGVVVFGQNVWDKRWDVILSETTNTGSIRTEIDNQLGEVPPTAKYGRRRAKAYTCVMLRVHRDTNWRQLLAFYSDK